MKTWFTEMGFPSGLAQVMVDAHKVCPLRIFIVDNSGSMSIQDGKVMVSGKTRKCSRWEELRETILFHGNVAAGTHAQIDFRLLNPAMGAPQLFTVGSSDPSSPETAAALTMLNNAMKSSPCGGTPLCHHVNQVAQIVRTYASEMAQRGHKAQLVICTDGQASDGNLGDALKVLQGLPINVCAKLCTDQDDVVDYYGDIDKNLEFSIDVLDDLKGEAKEIKRFNPWLTYGDPIQKAREFGIHHKLFDLIDERKFSLARSRTFAIFSLAPISPIRNPTSTRSKPSCAPPLQRSAKL